MLITTELTGRLVASCAATLLLLTALSAYGGEDAPSLPYEKSSYGADTAQDVTFSRDEIVINFRAVDSRAAAVAMDNDLADQSDDDTVCVAMVGANCEIPSIANVHSAAELARQAAEEEEVARQAAEEAFERLGELVLQGGVSCVGVASGTCEPTDPFDDFRAAVEAARRASEEADRREVEAHLAELEESRQAARKTFEEQMERVRRADEEEAMRAAEEAKKRAAEEVCLICAGVEEPLPDDGESDDEEPLPDDRNPYKAAYWETDEYRESKGLPLINASEGYRQNYSIHTGSLGGEGKTIAVLDDGVNWAHYDFPYVREFSYDFMKLDRDHGTAVAGIAAARRNGSGMHGVAYAADIVSLGECLPASNCGIWGERGSGEISAANVASAAGLNRRYPIILREGRKGFLGIGYRRKITTSVGSNPNAESDIINMSYGYEAEVEPLVRAMKDAASAGKIMVAALGNDNRTGPSGSPASNVADTGIAGSAIAVGALNEYGTQAPYSNTCGRKVANYCLFAPGYVFTTQVEGDYGFSQGTSFAAPHVSGAAAVVWAAFPNKGAPQIVNRLLKTAKPISEYQWSEAQRLGQRTAVDDRFGWGALDLGAAMYPAGVLSLKTPEETMVSVDESYVTLPPGFAAPTYTHALANAIVYDEMMFPFHHNLATSFQTSDRSGDGVLRDFVSELGSSSNISFGRAGVNLQVVQEDMTERHWSTLEENRRHQELDGYRFSLTPVPGVTIALGQGLGSTGRSNGFVTERTNRTIFSDALSVAPFAALAGRGSGVNVGWKMDHGTTIDMVGIDGRGYNGSSSAQLASLGLTREIADGMILGTRYGILREKGSLMGIQAAGAFANAGHATTEFVDVSVEGRVSDNVTLFGSVSQRIAGGGTRGAKNSLMSELRVTRAGSFVIGAELEHLLHASDRTIMTVSSPFRADRATAHLNLPDREVADQVVAYSRRSIDLVPKGREYRVQWVYEMKPGTDFLGLGSDALSVAIGSYLRMEPGHDKADDLEYGAAAKIRVSF